MANFWENDPLVSEPAASPPRGEFWANDPIVGETQPQQSTQPAGKPEAFNPGLGVARDLVEGIPILGPLYTNAVDHLTSNVLGMVTGEDPQVMRDRQEARHEAYQDENPILSTAAQITGGALTTAPLAGTAIGAKALGIAPGMTPLARGVAGLISGGTVTGADALARGDTAQEAGTKALFGAGLGAGGALIAPVVAPLATKAVDGGKAALARMGFGEAPVSTLPYNSTAKDVVTRALAADGSLGAQGLENVAAGGARAMVGDAGPTAMSLLDTAIQRSGPGAREAIAAIEARAAAANKDITGALDTYLGKPRGLQTMVDDVRNGSAGARKSAYDAAYQQPIDYASEKGMAVESLIKRVPQDVINTANKMMQLEGQQSAQILARIADDGSVQYMRMPDVRQLDYITRALNQAAKSGEGQGALGGQTDIGRIYGNLAREIRDAARDAAPAYDDALKTAASPIRLREALSFGNDIMKPQTPRDVVAETLDAMTPPEMDAIRAGLRSNLDEVFANVRTAISNPNADIAEARKALADLSTRAAVEKIQLVLKDPAAFNDFYRRLSEARRALEMRAGVAANSRTFARTAANDAIDDQVRGGAINAAMRGEPVNFGRSMVQNITGRTPAGEQAMSDAVYADIARMMTAQGPQAQEILLNLGHQVARKQPVASVLPGAVAPSADAVSRMLGLN